MPMGPLYVLLGKVPVQILCPFLIWIVCLPSVESYVFFIYFGEQMLVGDIIGKYVFLHGCFSFRFADVFFSYADAF